MIALLIAAYFHVQPVVMKYEAKGFDFKDPKGVNAVSILMDSTLEPIIGMADGISGEIMFDAARPEATSGQISVDMSSMRLSNESMTKYAMAAEYLDSKLHPTVEFKIKKVNEVKKTGAAEYTLTVDGEFRLRGASRAQSVVLVVTDLPGRMGDRMRGGKGDLIAVRSRFTLKRSEFGVKPAKDKAEYDVLADDVQIGVAIVGTRRGT